MSSTLSHRPSTAVGRARSAAPPGDRRRHAHKIAEAVNVAWHQAHGHGRLDVPVSVVAALSFLTPDAADRERAAADLFALNTPNSRP